MTAAAPRRRRRYIPVEARRWALRIYRQRRTGTYGLDDPLAPVEAIRDTVRFFAGHLARAVAQGHDPARISALTDGWSAAEYYARRLRTRPWRNAR